MTMKRFIYMIAMLAAMSAAASCVQEEAPVVNNEDAKDAVVFSATFSETPASKATLTEGVESSTVAWEENDEVIIFDGTDWYDYVATPDTENTKNATLSPKTESASVAGKYHALFLHPAGADATIDGDVITTTLPAVQVAVPNTFATHLAVAKSSGNSFAFKNVCGLVRVTLTTTDVKSVVLEGLNDEVVAGGIKINVSDEPTWEVDGANGSKTVTLKAEGDVAIVPGVYFFAVLPQTFENGFKVTINRAAGDPVVRTTAAGVTVERCQIVKGNANSVLGAGTEANPYVLNTAEDMCQMRNLAPVGEETWFKLGADIDMADVEKWTPVNYDGNFERMIHFDGAKVVNPKTKADCYTISNFAPTSFVNESDVAANYPSIFGVLYGSCKNVNIVNASVAGTAVTGIVGGYVGTTGKPAECVNVHVQGTVAQTKSDRTGGFAGVGRNATMSNCSVDVVITSTRPDVGGFFGRTYDSVVMTECTANVDIESSTTEADSWRSRVGGLIGYVSGNSVEITDCHSTGVIKDVLDASSSHTAAMGGLVGHLSSTDNQVTDCSSSVNIETTYGASIGGAVGINGAGALMMKNISTSGNIKGTTNLGGLIGIVEYPVTKVSLDGCSSTSSVNGTGHYCGGFAGWIQATGDGSDDTIYDITIEDCHAAGNVVSTGSSISAFVGGLTEINATYPAAKASFVDCYSTGNVTGSNNLGGLVGNLNSVSSLTDCYTTGSVTGGNTIGGICGNINKAGTIVSDTYHTGGTITGVDNVGGINGNGYADSYTNCYAQCTVKSTGINVGGIVGYQRAAVSFNKCYFKGDVSAARHVGGIVGRSNGNTSLTDCYATGSRQISSNETWVGGLVAYSAYPTNITRCYSDCTVTGGKFAGGIMGQCTKAATFDSCIAWGTATAVDASVGAFAGAAGDGSTALKSYYNPEFTPAAGATGLHGTVAGVGETVSSLATTLGWDSAIWDLTGDYPVLK